MKNLKHTKGECIAYKNSAFYEVNIRSAVNPTMTVNVFLTDMGGDVDLCHSGENKANADLIAEAFNVANETGYTPSQLADQKAELLEALEHCRNGLEATHIEAAKPFIDLADNAIKKATGEV